MNNEQQEPQPAGIGEQEVAAYLRQHPDFFQRHDQLLAELRLPHPDTGQAVSLVERQIALLREQKDLLEQRLRRLAEAARTNEALLERIQALILEIIASPTLRAAMDTLDDHLRHSFHADAVAVRLFAPGQGPEFVARDDPALGAFAAVLKQGSALCGRLNDEQRGFLFGVAAEEVASGAVIPLFEPGAQEAFGLLGVGSVDPRRFHPEMGTVFLGHLGAVVARLFRDRLEG